MGGGASRSWEHDRDTLHRTDSHSRRVRAFPRHPRRPTRSSSGRWSGYHFPRAGKGLVRKYLAKVTGSDAQLTRLIGRAPHGPRDHRLRPPARPFAPTRPPTRCCWPRWTRPWASSRDRRRSGSCGACATSSATGASSVWRGSRTHRNGRLLDYRTSDHYDVRAVRASCASTPCTAATATARSALPTELSDLGPAKVVAAPALERQRPNVGESSHIPSGCRRVPADHLSPFLNHHRACLFAVEVEGANGRSREPGAILREGH